MLVKNKHNSDTAGSYHITIVSFNKHFLKLYIFIMQGSSLVDVEANCVWGVTPFFSTVRRLTNIFLNVCSQTLDFAFVLKPKFLGEMSS